jgi:hypothetical protein
MTGSISPEQLQDLLAGYVLYNLSPEESATLAALLAINPELWQTIDQLQQTLEVTHDSVSLSPPTHLRTAVLQAGIDPRSGSTSGSGLADPRSFREPQPSSDRALRSRPWGRLWGVAAAVLIAGLGISNMLLWRTLQLERASQPGAETLTIDLGSPDDPALGQAQVVIDPDTLMGSLTVDNLPPLEPGTVYVLWTVVDPNAPLTLDDKDAILTTVFTVDEQGRSTQAIDLPPVYRRDRNLVRAVAITQENAAAPQEHRSAPLLIQPLQEGNFSLGRRH